MVIEWLDLAGVVVFAVAAALHARRARLDVFGVVVVALVTSLGGGTVRDLLLGRTPVFWVIESRYVVIATVAALLAFITMRQRHFPPRALSRLLLVADALGLAVFTVIGVQVALASAVSPLVSVIMGVMTGTFGGLIRDVLSNEIPLILRREVYATASLAGGTAYVLSLALAVPADLAIALSLAVTFGVRMISIRARWSLPSYEG